MSITQAMRLLELHGGSVARRKWRRSLAIKLAHENTLVCTRTRMVIALGLDDIIADDWEHDA